MNIVLLGYGKMGKVIESIANKRGHTIFERIDKDNASVLKNINSANVDVAIEFSQPNAAFDNISTCLKQGIPVVSGTTGWLDKKPQIESICLESKGAFFYASNYSIGVNLFFQLNKQLAKLMERTAGYDVSIEEIHHIEKKDAPSGTAITLAEGVIDHSSQKKNWTLDHNVDESALVIDSKRLNDVPGTHTIKYDSGIDAIEIKHTAHNREGFALGAVMVAEWIINKKGVLSMDDFLKLK